MNVRFIKDWKNPDTGSTHKTGSIHKVGTSAARQLVKRGFCEEIKDQDAHMNEIYRADQKEQVEEQVTEQVDEANDDLGTAGRVKNFFNRK